MKTFINGLIKENPVFVLLLGLCSTLAITTTVENAYLMGLCVLIVLLFSNFTISLIRKLVPENVKIPVYILIISTFVTITEILVKEYSLDLYKALGIYLPLIAVNCIILGRALTVASNSKVGNSVLDALGTGIGFTIVITMVAFIRELLGSNTLTLMDKLTPLTGYSAVYVNILPKSDIIPMSLLLSPAGAFITLGFLIALFNKLKGGKNNESN